MIELQQKFAKLAGFVSEPPIIKVEIPDVQKVDVQNPTPKADPIIFPDIQKVHVENQPEPVKVIIPETQKSFITNVKEFAKIFEFPDFSSILKREIAKIEMPDIPMGEGDIPKKADPTRYVNVRLTNGKSFYNALKDAWVSAGLTGGKAGGSGNPALLGFNISGQTKITSTGVAVQLQSNKLLNGVILTALSTNSAPLVLGGASVSNTIDGTGNGFILEAGAGVSFAVTNTNTIYINGSIGDVVSFAGS
jgi:hypothetical protein